MPRRHRRNHTPVFKSKVALAEAINVHGVPEIVSTDLGSQFTFQTCLENTASASAWMAKKHGVTMHLSNDCGDP